MVYISSCCSSYFYLFYLGPSNTCAICAMGHWESYPPCRSVHFGWPPPTPHSRVHGMDLWVRCPDACMRPGIQCTTEPGPNTRRSTLSPTSTLAHRLVVIYWASSRLARSPKFPLHNAQRPSHSAPHTRPTACRMASNWCWGQTLGKADQHVTNTGDADLRSICAHLLAPTCSSNAQSQYPARTAGNNSW